MKANNSFRLFSLGTVWLWLLIFAIIPNVALLLVSLLDKGAGAGDYFIPVFTLGNYFELFTKTEFVRIFTLTFFISLASTILCLVIGYPFAYFLARTGKNSRHWLLMLLMIPFWTNSLIRTYALKVILQSNGLISTLLFHLGIIDDPRLNMLNEFTNLSVFIGMTYTFLPFMILPLYASLEKLDVRLLDAARDLGATPWVSFVRITLPLTMPGIVAGCILVFLPALGCFYVQDMLGGSLHTYLGSYIRTLFIEGTSPNWPRGAAASMALTLLLFLLALLYKMSSSKAGVQPGRGKGRLRRRQEAQ